MIDINSIEADYILVSHAHWDHTADVEAIASRTGAPIIAIWEIHSWYEKLGLKTLTLLTNNPDKVAAIRDAGITCTQQPILVAVNEFNEKYVATKENKLGHNRGSK
jgi:L-ascorbate metabolism protein UlaG (beta-lactamase superfamily)